VACQDGAAGGRGKGKGKRGRGGGNTAVAEAPAPKKAKDLSKIKCFHCKQFGHYLDQCSSKLKGEPAATAAAAPTVGGVRCSSVCNTHVCEIACAVREG